MNTALARADFYDLRMEVDLLSDLELHTFQEYLLEAGFGPFLSEEVLMCLPVTKAEMAARTAALTRAADEMRPRIRELVESNGWTWAEYRDAVRLEEAESAGEYYV